MKKKILLLLLLAAACKPEIKPGGDFFGTIAEESIASGWEQDARISVFDGNSGNSEYAYAGEASARSGKFTAKKLNSDGITLPGRYGVYPYMSSTIVTNAECPAASLFSGLRTNSMPLYSQAWAK